jgi:hypothetical protein
MKYKDDEWRISQDDDNKTGSSGNVQVPPSLASNVLHRLGLTPEQTPSAISAEEWIARLKGSDWELRAAAVRALGRLEHDIPVELLVSALDDEDESVRAAAVHVLGNIGKWVPLDRLAEALHDSAWHVRETAVLTLGKQEQHVPDEVFITALRDTDGSVREAARLALQWNAPEERIAATYGRLWEKKIMQQNDYNATLSDDKQNRSPFETVPNNAFNGTAEYGGDSARSHGPQEQAQEYLPQEHAFYEYGDAVSSHGEKLIPHRRSSQKGWWAVIAVTAILFFLIGSSITRWAIPFPIPNQVQFVKVAPVMPQPQPVPFLPFKDPRYALMLQDDIASALHLSPGQIRVQLQEGKSMTDIAAAQGISASQLQNIELKAFGDVYNEAVKAGDISQQDASNWMYPLQSNPQMLDKMASVVFFIGP